MNNLLELKGTFDQKKRGGGFGAKGLPSHNSIVTLEHINDLLLQLKSIKEYWEQNTIINNCLLSVYYTEIIAKSNRIQTLFSKDVDNSNSTIVGAKYYGNNTRKHIITHCVSHSNLDDSIQKLELAKHVVETLFGDQVNGLQIEQINKNLIDLPLNITKTKFVGVVVDCYHVEKFSIETEILNIKEDQIVTLYDTGNDITELMHRIGIVDFLPVRKIDNTTVLLYPDQLRILKEKAPYLISMSVSDLADLTRDDFAFNTQSNNIHIPDPTNEPTVGVIDTAFDDSVYFSKWVENHSKIDLTKYENVDYSHGTRVTSIIVDGPTLNKNLDDHCGRFKVRHFCVTPGGKFSSFNILQSIKEIIEENRDIKVWNLSLGSILEVNANFISPEAAILDRIQYENDVLFIVSGTNKTINGPEVKRIGSPADSINSIVVNAVDENGKPTDYSREGVVLSFFNKPDIAYYGGTDKKPLMACDSHGTYYVKGTSYAAPWITRKVAFLIHNMGLSREIAKALIIDSAVQWKQNEEPSKLIGFGVVPIKIEEIISSNNDEIKFVMQGVSELYDTYTYKIPVPIYENKQPYIAKATLCYFPKCNRNQGVDYTNTEMDLHFGRLRTNGKGICTINDNKQNEDEETNYLKEAKARAYFRKWDNVKHICEHFKQRGSAKEIFGNGLWGLSIKTVDRLNGKDGKGLRFGIVITLKEIKGVNRFYEFKQLCSLKAWLVNEISLQNRIELYNKAEQEITFED